MTDELIKDLEEKAFKLLVLDKKEGFIPHV